MNQRIIVGVAAFIALCAGIVGALYIAPPGFKSKLEPQYFQSYPEPRALAPFELTDHQSNPFTRSSLMGQWSLVFVGYTFCPDICPTTMAELNAIYPQLQQIDSDMPIRVVFVSVDPKRDSISRLSEYVSYFNKEFIAITGEHKSLFPFVRNLGMMYAIAESTDNPNYLVDHSASVVLIDPEARVIGRFKPKREPGKLSISDSQQILEDMPVIISK
ncbi:SCO family protein [Alteromonas sp. D210916BOD_24]|uniref:SCO family protein n=1 Tax=Alteromonas sp. D210916BOD_24 TaxID=3157618 RepID=UPI00399C7EC9